MVSCYQSEIFGSVNTIFNPSIRIGKESRKNIPPRGIRNRMNIVGAQVVWLKLQSPLFLRFVHIFSNTFGGPRPLRTPCCAPPAPSCSNLYKRVKNHVHATTEAYRLITPKPAFSKVKFFLDDSCPSNRLNKLIQLSP